jgi:imidazolonepropionase-like amidohydrolase
MWALPGLVDAHAHLAAAELDYRPGNLEGATARAAESLRAGVTLVLDKGWTDDVAIRLIDEVPETDRPEIEAAARIITSMEGYFPGFATEVDASSLQAAVREQAAAGRGWVKLIGDWPRRGVGPMANFSEVELAGAVAAAEEAGARVAIHTMARDVPSMAVAAGVHSIEHGLFLEESDIGALAARGGMWVPTVTRCEATLAQLGETSSGGRLFVEGLGRIRRLLPLAVEAGVNVLAGTDLVGSPANVADEALRLADYGLSNTQVVTAVSVGAYAATRRPQPFAVGSPADAVFFGADPIAELGTLGSPRHVVRLGRVL